MIANIETAIKALGNYEFVIDGDVNSQSDWDNNVRFIYSSIFPHQFIIKIIKLTFMIICCIY